MKLSILAATAGLLCLTGLSWAAGSGVATNGEPERAVEWVTIHGGKFMMGADDVYDAKPVHEASVKTFQISKTLVTVEQYAQCMVQGKCAPPDMGWNCNYWHWLKTDPGRDLRHDPINCVDFDRAQQYAAFMEARLPTETEWEYAAKSEGQALKYPWGDDAPSCEKAVIDSNGGPGCGARTTLPVCSKPAGNTAQGLCDMAGNVREWVQDKYQQSYAETPADGGAFEARGSGRVLRGGAFSDSYRMGMSADFRTDSRRYGNPFDHQADVGFRLAETIP